MGVVAYCRAVRRGAAPSAEALERLLATFQTMSHIFGDEWHAFLAYDCDVYAWRYFAAVFARAGGASNACQVTDDPLTWIVYGRRSVPRLEPSYPSDYPENLIYEGVWTREGGREVSSELRYSTPDDVAAIDARMESVEPLEYEKMFKEELAREYAASGLEPSSKWDEYFTGRALSSEAMMWGRLRAFYARAAAEKRYVVTYVGP